MSSNDKFGKILLLLKDGKTYDEIATLLKVGYSAISKVKKTLPNYFAIKDTGSNKSVKFSQKKGNFVKGFSREDKEFLVKIIIRITHRRQISQSESKRALDIINDFS